METESKVLDPNTNLGMKTTCIQNYLVSKNNNYYCNYRDGIGKFKAWFEQKLSNNRIQAFLWNSKNSIICPYGLSLTWSTHCTARKSFSLGT